MPGGVTSNLNWYGLIYDRQHWCGWDLHLFDSRCEDTDGSDYSSLFDTASRVARRDDWWFSTTVIKSAWYQVTPSFVGCGTLDADGILLPLWGNNYFLTRYVMVAMSILTAINLVMFDCQQTDYRFHCVSTANWMQTMTMISNYTYLRCWHTGNDIYLEDLRSGFAYQFSVTMTLFLRRYELGGWAVYACSLHLG